MLSRAIHPKRLQYTKEHKKQFGWAKHQHPPPRPARPISENPSRLRLRAIQERGVCGYLYAFPRKIMWNLHFGIYKSLLPLDFFKTFRVGVPHNISLYNRLIKIQLSSYKIYAAASLSPPYPQHFRCFRVTAEWKYKSDCGCQCKEMWRAPCGVKILYQLPTPTLRFLTKVFRNLVQTQMFLTKPLLQENAKKKQCEFPEKIAVFF